MHGGSCPVSLWGSTSRCGESLYSSLFHLQTERAATPPTPPGNTARPGTLVSRGKALAQTSHSSRGTMSPTSQKQPQEEPPPCPQPPSEETPSPAPKPAPGESPGAAAAAAALPSPCCLRDSPRAAGTPATAQPAPGAAGPAGPSSGMGLSPLPSLPELLAWPAAASTATGPGRLGP